MSSTLILTARHLAEVAGHLTVRLSADTPNERVYEWTGESYSSEMADIAFVAIHIDPSEVVPSPVLARVGPHGSAVPCVAVGFPLFKLRQDGSEEAVSPFRESHQANGTLSPLSNMREGTLEVTVAPPAEATDPNESPWGGMSGAALWVDGAIVGVVTRHRTSPDRSREFGGGGVGHSVWLVGVILAATGGATALGW